MGGWKIEKEPYILWHLLLQQSTKGNNVHFCEEKRVL